MRTFIISCFIVLFASCNIYKEVQVKEVRDVRLSEFGSDGLKAEVDILVENPNSFKFKVTDSDLNVSINGTNIGKVKLGEKLTIDKSSTNLYTLHFKSDYDDLSPQFLQSLITLIFVNYAEFSAQGYVKGRAMLVSKKVKVDLKEKVNLRE